MDNEGSVTARIRDWRMGDGAAAEDLWQRYQSRLVNLCRRRLADTPRRAADEEDVALSVFDSLCAGLQQGRFPLLQDRDNLWRMLVVIAARKASDYAEHERRAKRGGGRVIAESELCQDSAAGGESPLEQVLAREPTVELAACMAEQYERLMDTLPDDTVRAVAIQKLNGYTNEEIAVHLGCSLRSVERKLWLIRTKWTQAEKLEA